MSCLKKTDAILLLLLSLLLASIRAQGADLSMQIPDSPNSLFEMQVVALSDFTFDGKPTITINAELRNKLNKPVILHFPPVDFIELVLTNATGERSAIGDHRDVEDNDPDDEEVLEPIHIPGGSSFSLLDIQFRPSDGNTYSLAWGPYYISQIAPGNYSATVIWRGPAVSVEGLGVMPWAPGIESWNDDHALKSSLIKLVLTNH